MIGKPIMDKIADCGISCYSSRTFVVMFSFQIILQTYRYFAMVACCLMFSQLNQSAKMIIKFLSFQSTLSTVMIIMMSPLSPFPSVQSSPQ